MLFVFKATSDQAGIKKAKNLVKGHFLAIRLYRDDIGLMLDTMKNIILSNLFYMRKSLRPMLFLVVPVGVILVQIGSRYEFRPLAVGESMVVSMRLAEKISAADLSKVELDLPEGLHSDIPPVRIEARREISWRIRAEKPGDYDLAFLYNGSTVSKRLRVVDFLVPLATKRAHGDLAVSAMNPSESGLPASSFASMISIRYPKRELYFLGFNINWLVAFFIFSMVAAFACKGFLGVEV